MKFTYLLSLGIGIVFALLSAPSTVVAVILKLDDKSIASDTYLINGLSDTDLNSIKFNVLNEESCSKLEQFIVIESPESQDGIGVSRDMEEVCRQMMSLLRLMPLLSM